ncbi:MAG: hypothetical protein Q8P67_17900 [archaeon]|nr:hypothetical protein [archaeon]
MAVRRRNKWLTFAKGGEGGGDLESGFWNGSDGRERRWRAMLLWACVALLIYCVWQWTAHGPYGEIPEESAWRRLEGPFSQESDEEWVTALQSEPVMAARRFTPADAASHKFLVLLASGRAALAKPLQCVHAVLPRALSDYDRQKHGAFSLLEGDPCQGWPDLLGYHLDRLLGLHRKPPAAGRRLSNKQLYSGARLFGSDWKEALDWLLWWLPSYSIDCLLLPWLRGLQEGTAAWALLQSKPLVRFLTDPQQPPSLLRRALRPEQAYLALDVSDTLLFDYLLEDHDRQAEKNWVLQESSSSPPSAACPRLAASWSLPCPATVLLWDSGLAFQHGPHGVTLPQGDAPDADPMRGTRDCLTVLRGSNMARNLVTVNQTGHHLCRFRAATVAVLRAFRVAPPQQRLGALLDGRLRSDPLYPQSRYAIYEGPDGWWWDRLRFSLQPFLDGIDLRLDRLLQHVSSCLDLSPSPDAVLLVDLDLFATLAALPPPQKPTLSDSADWTPEELRQIESTMKKKPHRDDND